MGRATPPRGNTARHDADPLDVCSVPAHPGDPVPHTASAAAGRPRSPVRLPQSSWREPHDTTDRVPHPSPPVPPLLPLAVLYGDHLSHAADPLCRVPRPCLRHRAPACVTAAALPTARPFDALTGVSPACNLVGHR